MAGSIQRPGAWGTRWPARALLALAALVAWSQPISGHDIPASVVVQTFARPEGARFNLLIRLPLVSMRDFPIPSRDGALLDVPRAQAMLDDMVRTWVTPAVRLFEDGQTTGAPVVLATRLALPSNRAFASYDEAIAHLQGPSLDAATTVPVPDALLDAWIAFPIRNDRARFSIEPEFARFGIRVVTTMRFLMPEQPERAFEFMGDPGLVPLDPRWHQAAWRFVRLGFAHILDGIDHLLFLLCLVVPFRRFWDLVKVVTAFTVAHSVTLFCAAFGLVPDALWFPPLIETLIAVSIVYMAIENIVVASKGSKGTGPESTGFPQAMECGKPVVEGPVPLTGALRRRWMIAFGFGLVHGFGFSFALRETLQFAGSHLVTSLVSFNVGVELGQLLVLIIILPVLAFLFRAVIEERIGIIIASALIAHTAWHWMVDRAATLRQYDWALSGPAALASLLRVAMVVVAVIGAIWLWRIRRQSRPPST